MESIWPFRMKPSKSVGDRDPQVEDNAPVGVVSTIDFP